MDNHINISKMMLSLILLILLPQYNHTDALLKIFDENVRLQMKVERIGNVNHIVLNCTSIYHPFDPSAEFLINNVTKANIRYSNGTCVINRRICKVDECSCTSRTFAWTVSVPVDIEYRIFTCQLRFNQRKPKGHLLVYKMKSYDGSVISEERTRTNQISISSFNSTTGNTNTKSGSVDYMPMYISLGIFLPLTIVAVYILWLKCFKGHDTDKDKAVENEDKPLTQNDNFLLETTSNGLEAESDILSNVRNCSKKDVVFETDKPLTQDDNCPLETTQVDVSSHVRKCSKKDVVFNTECETDEDKAAPLEGCKTDEDKAATLEGCETDEDKAASLEGCETDEDKAASLEGCETDEDKAASPEGCGTDEDKATLLEEKPISENDNFPADKKSNCAENRKITEQYLIKR